MASQMLLRHHISNINNTRISFETNKVSIVFLNSKRGSGLGEQLFRSRISSGRILHDKSFYHLRAQGVGGSKSGAFSYVTNDSWKSIVGEANSHKAVILTPPNPPADGSFVQVLSYIWNLAAGDPSLHWRLSIAIILLLGSKLAGFGGPFLFKRAMDELATGSTKLQSENYIYVVGSLLILSSLTKAFSSGLNEVRYVVFAPLGHAVGRRIGVYLLQHILYLDLSFHLDQSSGVLLRILERAQRSVIHIFRAVVFTFIPTAIELVLVCILLSHQVGAAVAGIVLLAFVAYVIWTVKITTVAASSRVKANKFEERVSGKAIDALLNYETVVQFSNQSIEVVQYNQLLQSYQHAMDSLRQAVAVVPQDTVLFNDTIFHNILYGLPTASETDVIRAATQAHLHEAVLQMPKGYMTVVGERGLKLSGGEKQRVAIARAFLKGPRLLICDEATSALDSSTEASILQSLQELATGRTCVFVAHRLSTIMHCDKIMVLDDGRIVEEGTHKKLLARKGIYATMWSLQEAQNDKKCSKV